jgi:adiponectin receptor
VRFLVFGSMASLAFVPLIFGLFVHGVDQMVLLGSNFYVLAAPLNMLCGAFYALQSLISPK